MISIPMSPITESTCGFVDVVDVERVLLREVMDPDMERVGVDSPEIDTSIDCYSFFVS